MSDQRIHQFKVFRGSSKAKEKKIISCSFISKSSSVDILKHPVPERPYKQIQSSQLKADKRESTQINYDSETTVGVADNNSRNNNVLPKEQSLQFIYHEEDTDEQSKIQSNVQLQELRIEESSIDIQESSGWIDLQRISPAFTPQIEYPAKYINERKVIEQERLQLQKQKEELDKKKREIQILFNQLDKIKNSCSRMDSPISPGIKGITISRFEESSNSAHHSKENLYCRFDKNQWKSIEIDTLDHKIKQQKLQKQLEKMQKNHHLSKQQKAREAILLQTCWINLIKNENQIRALNNRFVKGAFFLLKNHSKMSKFCDLINSATYVLDLMALGHAFVRMKKMNTNNWKAPMIRKNLVIKLAKRQSKQNIDPDCRGCETDRIRSRHQSQQIDLMRNKNMISVMEISNQNKVTEIDAIIRAALYRNKLVKIEQEKLQQERKFQIKKVSLKPKIQIQVNVQRVQKAEKSSLKKKIPFICALSSNASRGSNLRQKFQVNKSKVL